MRQYSQQLLPAEFYTDCGHPLVLQTERNWDIMLLPTDEQMGNALGNPDAITGFLTLFFESEVFSGDVGPEGVMLLRNYQTTTSKLLVEAF